MDFSPTLIGCRTASERSRLPDVHGRMPRACHFSAARQLDHAACGRKTRFSATLHPASAARVPQDRSWPGRPRGQHGSPFSCLGPAGLRRRPHAFHTGARRWNRGHGRDLAKSQRNRSRTASAHRDRKKIQNRDRESKSDAKSRSLNFSWFSCTVEKFLSHQFHLFEPPILCGVF